MIKRVLWWVGMPAIGILIVVICLILIDPLSLVRIKLRVDRVIPAYVKGRIPFSLEFTDKLNIRVKKSLDLVADLKHELSIPIKIELGE